MPIFQYTSDNEVCRESEPLVIVFRGLVNLPTFSFFKKLSFRFKPASKNMQVRKEQENPDS